MSELSPRARAEAQRILDKAARRILDERLRGHETFVAPELTADGQRYRAECGCGWISDDAYLERAHAERDAQAHTEGAG